MDGTMPTMSDSTPPNAPLGSAPEGTVAAAREANGIPTRLVTLCFLVRGDEVLLAMKKRGFGVGRWYGTGGKVQPGEQVHDAAMRETQEEIGVVPRNLAHVATIDFYFAHNPTQNQRGEIFLCSAWDGDPHETEEMAPRWFPIADIPYDAMWSDDPRWLPRILAGEKLSAAFVFGPDDIVLDNEIHPLT